MADSFQSANPLTAKSDGRFGKQDFVYLPTEDVYRCPAGEKLTYRYTNEEDGKTLRRYWTTACPRCPFKSQCTTAPQRRITRWEHEHVLEAVQQRLDENPQAMHQRRETADSAAGCSGKLRVVQSDAAQGARQAAAATTAARVGCKFIRVRSRGWDSTTGPIAPSASQPVRSRQPIHSGGGSSRSGRPAPGRAGREGSEAAWAPIPETWANPFDSGSVRLSCYPFGSLDVHGMKSPLSVLDVKTDRIYHPVGASKCISD